MRFFVAPLLYFFFPSSACCILHVCFGLAFRCPFLFLYNIVFLPIKIIIIIISKGIDRSPSTMFIVSRTYLSSFKFFFCALAMGITKRKY